MIKRPFLKNNVKYFWLSEMEKKMKVGLVPLLYNEYNYGGVLQFYALQKVLKNNEIENDIIYYDNDEIITQKELAFFQKLILS